MPADRPPPSVRWPARRWNGRPKASPQSPLQPIRPPTPASRGALLWPGRRRYRTWGAPKLTGTLVFGHGADVHVTTHAATPIGLGRIFAKWAAGRVALLSAPATIRKVDRSAGAAKAPIVADFRAGRTRRVRAVAARTWVAMHVAVLRVAASRGALLRVTGHRGQAPDRILDGRLQAVLMVVGLVDFDLISAIQWQRAHSRHTSNTRCRCQHALRRGVASNPL